jgi:D-alanyl-D-alanine carboxypeptidase
MVAPDTADARRYRHHGASQQQTAQVTTKRVTHHSIRESGYSPPFASIVVDANTAKTLDEKNADSLRHPASLTKIMTLYLLFEQLDAGKMKLTGTMPVSEHAAGQSPTKLGLRPGSSLEVEDAIRGLVTRSANDAAVVIAEAIGGDEETFAQMMTAKAHALGMGRTTYMNASGLPDDDQVTTARDQALLGRAIQERFPRYYRYFSTASFTWRGEEIRNHNHLLGRVEGVDGIKTGYTNASGFNLVTSVRRGDRHIVAVVLGGSSGGSRDAKMRDLIEEHVAEASTRHTATMIAEAAEAAPAPAPAPSRSIRPAQTAAAAAAPARAAGAAGFALSSASSVPVTPSAATTVQGPAMIKHAATGSTDPIKPIAVKTVKVKLAPSHTASLAPVAPMIPVEETSSTAPAPVAGPAAVAPTPVAAARAPPALAPAPLLPAPAAARAAPAQPEARGGAALALQAEPAKPAALAVVAAVAEPAARAEPARSTPVRSGWIVQVGAFGSDSEAKQHLDEAQSKAKSLLGHADPFTEAVTKGDKTYYRARFAGLDRDRAEAACKQLRRSDIACMTIKN